VLKGFEIARRIRCDVQAVTEIVRTVESLHQALAALGANQVAAPEQEVVASEPYRKPVGRTIWISTVARKFAAILLRQSLKLTRRATV
jgi:hypothetical protein